RPLTRREIATVAGVDRATVDARLGDLEVALADRGVRLVLSGDRVELVTAPDAGGLIARYVGADAIRLSPASLETLAIVAYRQPATQRSARLSTSTSRRWTDVRGTPPEGARGCRRGVPPRQRGPDRGRSGPGRRSPGVDRPGRRSGKGKDRGRRTADRERVADDLP